MSSNHAAVITLRLAGIAAPNRSQEVTGHTHEWPM